MKRKLNLLPNNVPKYVRVYDNEGETYDRYTVVFTGRYRGRDESFIYLGMSSNPFHPMGFGNHGESETLIDTPSYKHLGKKVDFQELPEDCKKATVETYKKLWQI